MAVVIVPDAECAKRLCAIERAAFPERRVFWSIDDYVGLGGPTAAVVTDDDQAKGLLVLKFAADEAEILDLGVVPSARRRGLARKLLALGQSKVVSAGCVRMVLEVALDNDGARAFYKSEGFTEAGKRRGYYLRAGGERIDALILEKYLSG